MRPRIFAAEALLEARAHFVAAEVAFDLRYVEADFLEAIARALSTWPRPVSSF